MASKRPMTTANAQAAPFSVFGGALAMWAAQKYGVPIELAGAGVGLLSQLVGTLLHRRAAK